MFTTPIPIWKRILAVTILFITIGWFIHTDGSSTEVGFAILSAIALVFISFLEVLEKSVELWRQLSDAQESGPITLSIPVPPRPASLVIFILAIGSFMMMHWDVFQGLIAGNPPAISTNTRFAFGVITAILALFVSIIGQEFTPHVVHWISPKTHPQPERKLSLSLWIALLLPSLITVLFGVIASTLPSAV